MNVAIQYFIQTGERRLSGHEQKTGSVTKYGKRFRADFKRNHIGIYVSKEKAEKALRHYIETGEKLKSSIKRCKGSIQKRKSGFTAHYRHKHIGLYITKEEAEKALKHFIQTGEKLKSSHVENRHRKCTAKEAEAAIENCVKQQEASQKK